MSTPGAVALAVDIGGTKIEAALVGADGRLVPGSRSRRPTGRELTPAGLRLAVRSCLDDSFAARGAADVIGVGIGSAGPVDLVEGRILPKNLPLLHGVAIRDEVGAVVPGRPAILSLDGTCIAVAEQWIGATSGTSSSMSLVVSTGIGGGIVLDGRIVGGVSGNAGHIGQMRIADPDGDGDGDSDGTLEGVASGPSSVEWARRRGWAGASGEDLARDCAADHPVALAAVRRSATAVGTAIASVATLLDLGAVAIGGGFSRVTPWYLDAVRDAAWAGAFFDYSRDVAVRRTGLGDEGPLIGAGALVHRPVLGGPS
ncbi:glucokinase [Rathayibacter sp. PhB127]|uniref:ROK family protein n=1 Tax=Rathayibacter sp. PhB127 TaxID=2485176 RepID=UPI000FA3FFC4|nr:ROK family protein [Rathayibacter sp. PhB127]ROS21572.1 glucokinase [Rathayibacter sp. PhB127]